MYLFVSDRVGVKKELKKQLLDDLHDFLFSCNCFFFNKLLLTAIIMG